ncbi:MAG: hypothetical protein EON93_20925 [Burkholderiales bacterium]|nr:MAG: hypothetical protein EON93_20925 [Burkholderiales bacterium]
MDKQLDALAASLPAGAGYPGPALREPLLVVRIHELLAQTAPEDSDHVWDRLRDIQQEAGLMPLLTKPVGEREMQETMLREVQRHLPRMLKESSPEEFWRWLVGEAESAAAQVSGDDQGRYVRDRINEMLEAAGVTRRYQIGSGPNRM